jgi:hypothetical protein
LLSNLSAKILNNKSAVLNNLEKYSESLIYSAKALAIDPNNGDALRISLRITRWVGMA